MRKFLIAGVAVAAFATSVLAEVRSCDTEWVRCVSGVNASHGKLAHDLQLACDRIVMECRRTGDFAGSTVSKNHPTKGIDWPRPDKGGKSVERGSPTTGATTGALNPNVGGGGAPTKPALSAPTRTLTGINKPPAAPPQLAERLRRLQQQRQY
jgi:hypothetical protein